MDLLLEVISKLGRRDAMLLCSDLATKEPEAKRTTRPDKYPFYHPVTFMLKLIQVKGNLPAKLLTLTICCFKGVE
jgi:hypothetical protein